MTERIESTVTTLSSRVGDDRYTARIEGNVAQITAQTIETYATLTLPLSALEGFAGFIDAVRADPAAAVAESEPAPGEPGIEPTPEGAES